MDGPTTCLIGLLTCPFQGTPDEDRWEMVSPGDHGLNYINALSAMQQYLEPPDAQLDNWLSFDHLDTKPRSKSLKHKRR